MEQSSTATATIITALSPVFIVPLDHTRFTLPRNTSPLNQAKMSDSEERETKPFKFVTAGSSSHPTRRPRSTESL